MKTTGSIAVFCFIGAAICSWFCLDCVTGPNRLVFIAALLFAFAAGTSVCEFLIRRSGHYINSEKLRMLDLWEQIRNGDEDGIAE